MKLSYLSVIFIPLFSFQTVFAVAAVPAAPTSVSSPCIITSMLKMGSRGAEVQCLQQKIGVLVDGIFGRLTYAGVLAFQTTHSLKADGIIGPFSRVTLNGIVASSGIYPLGCTSNIGYSTTTGAKCDRSLSSGTAEGGANSTNPNLKNLDIYVDAVKKRALKGGFPQDKLSFLEDKIRKGATTNNNFLQQFFDAQKEIYNKQISEKVFKTPAFAFLGKVISFVDENFYAKKAQAATGIPFGGFITYVNPLICDCPPGVITQIFVALPEAEPAISNLLLNYVNGTQAFSNYNIPEPSIAVLGFYEPGIPSCWTYVGESCVLIESDGQITPEVGSSLAP